MELEETAFDVRAMVHSALELQRPEATSKGLAFSVEIAPRVPIRAGGDPGRLRQVLLNLVGNAVKFTTTGSVRIDVRTLLQEPGGERLRFSVTDTGIGIAPDQMARLFDAFTQGDRSISRRFGGSGLGLSICRQLVERMGGKMLAESHLGEGSTFGFEIELRTRRATDLRDDTQGPPSSNAPTPAMPRTGLRILVAEDNETNRLVILRTLERQGHAVIAVTNGLDVVDAVQSGSFDVVLMDVQMPGQDGLAATRDIRALPYPACDVPVIGLTANALTSEVAAGRQSGMNAFATKPINAAGLALVIEQTLSAAEAKHSLHPASLPFPREKRGFDPAVLDRRVGAEGPANSASAVANFITRGRTGLTQLRTLARQDDLSKAATLAHSLALDAAAFGLMRAARAGLDLDSSASQDDLAHFTTLVTQGLDELKSWYQPPNS